MTPTALAEPLFPWESLDDVSPRFLDDAFDPAADDGDWWLDLGRVAIPTPPAV